MGKVAFSELLGFVGLDAGGNIRDEAFASRVGAKIGKEPPGPSTTPSGLQHADTRDATTAAEENL